MKTYSVISQSHSNLCYDFVKKPYNFFYQKHLIFYPNLANKYCYAFRQFSNKFFLIERFQILK